jgi:hypothetical protein
MSPRLNTRYSEYSKFDIIGKNFFQAVNFLSLKALPLLINSFLFTRSWKKDIQFLIFHWQMSCLMLSCTWVFLMGKNLIKWIKEHFHPISNFRVICDIAWKTRQIILLKLLFNTKRFLPPPSILLPHFNPEGIGIVSFHTTQNNLEWILFWKNGLPPSSECQLKMQTVSSSEILLSRLYVILI